MVIRKKLIVVMAELCLWSAVLGKSVTWTERTALRNTLHRSVFSIGTIPTSIGCMARCSSTPGCGHVTYLFSTSECHLHNTLEGRQTSNDSRVWSKNAPCEGGFLYNNQIGACLYFANTIKMNWLEAKHDCESRNGRLIVTNTTYKFEALVEQYAGNTSFWVGGLVDTSASSLPLPAIWITGEVIDMPLYGSKDFGTGDSGVKEQCLAFGFHGYLGKLTLMLLRCDVLNYYLCESI